MKCYPIRLLLDQRGIIDWLIWAPILWGIASTGLSTARGAYTQSAQIKAGKHAQERLLAFEWQSQKALEQADLAKLQEMTAMEKERTKQAKASGFQGGTRGGPYFQVVKR